MLIVATVIITTALFVVAALLVLFFPFIFVLSSRIDPLAERFVNWVLGPPPHE